MSRRYEALADPVEPCDCHRCTCTGCSVCTEPEEGTHD